MQNIGESEIESILGYNVRILPSRQCVKQIERWLEEVSPKVLICANPHSLVQAKNDPTFQDSLRNADLLVPDGYGIVLASRILGGSIRERVTGSDIFWGLSEALNDAKSHKNYFFLGSTEKTLATIKEKMARDFPNIRFAGCYSPSFKREFSEEENGAMVEAINATAPDVLWVGMTAPKQEKWIYQHKEKLNVKFIGAIGAVFDFYAGNVKRSHPFFQKLGLEWLPRLLQEPRRLFRRNFISSPLFLLWVFKQRLKR